MEWGWKKPWLVVLRVVIVIGVLQFQVFGRNSSNNGCFPEEKKSLLEFKSAYSNESLLPSWVNDPKSNCCEWERVTCDRFTGHVIHLSLQRLYKNQGLGNMALWCMNISVETRVNWSLFLSFKELRTLNLSVNCFHGFIWERDNRSKWTLKKLEKLDLSYNNLKQSVMEFLSALTSLNHLNLAYNDIGGLFPSKELSHLRNLVTLDLTANNLHGGLTNQATNPRDARRAFGAARYGALRAPPQLSEMSTAQV
ncbi:hypothetical protein PIB30_066395 [Stylosanthes scabra]|uniref:Leucine-rich repeat-containing N-terminal plant-type domain-containing protein n=1 Tax=Stylosanthes scabra TaxID=79078 RepID=A0ABU6XNN1_9FABA|nr:hypothetical protein [Stylosanthes scabra]